MDTRFEGSCLCGNVQFSVDGFSDKVANCYCSMCRKFHGAAFGTLVGVKGLSWLSGKGFLKDFVASNGTTRTFCSNCGSSIGFRVKGEPLESIELAISTFDVDIPVKVDAQIYTAYKPNWCELPPDLPAYSDGRTS
ncbi:glutathione-dependent formaldehyde-activating GFA [Vibrio sp. vnigr-6D03]|uniref:GFA family protein n=1 Tax=Vibrio sp. vnigr-6D03 TaxID=2058088 RepID=UPI000C323E8D|nr:GFA family protein [Vibrio sp. vnigr-6D03]PKF80647.1 glutathione-dependent formaldehyde-activating GFA [Vibrio sp. vnigr-6D03]